MKKIVLFSIFILLCSSLFANISLVGKVNELEFLVGTSKSIFIQPKDWSYGFSLSQTNTAYLKKHLNNFLELSNIYDGKLDYITKTISVMHISNSNNLTLVFYGGKNSSRCSFEISKVIYYGRKEIFLTKEEVQKMLEVLEECENMYNEKMLSASKVMNYNTD